MPEICSSFLPLQRREKGLWTRGAIVRTLSMLLLPSLGLSGVAVAGINRWTTNGPGGGLVASLTIDPVNTNTVYAGTFSGGAFKSTNGGGSWTAINNGFVLNPSAYITATDVQAIAVDPSSPATVYAATAWSGAFKSINGGASWTPASTGLPSVPVLALAIDPSSSATLYAGTGSGQAYGPGSGVFKSTDGGVSWVPSGLSGQSVGMLLLDSKAPATIYAGTGSSIFKSSNGGASWREIGSQLGTLAIDPVTTTTLYAGSYVGGLFKSTDGGESWAPVGTDPLVFNKILVDPSMPTTLYAGTGSGVAKSTDGGVHWVIFASVRDVRALVIDPKAPATLYANSGLQGGIVKTVDAGDHWAQVNAGLAASIVSSLALDPADPATLYAGTWSGIFKSTDGAGHWNSVSSVYPVSQFAVDPSKPSTVYAGVSGDGVFKTADGGATWASVNNGLTDPYVTALAADASGVLYAGTIFPGGGSSHLFRSINGGETWTQAGSFPVGVASIAIDASTPANVYVGTLTSRGLDGGIFGGERVGLQNMDVISIAVDPTSSGTLYAGTSFNGIFKSTDRGLTWTAINAGITGLPLLRITSIAIDPRETATLYVGTIGGVFKSRDGGSHWTVMNEGLSNTSVKSLAIDPMDPSKLHAGTDGGGVFSYQSLEPCAGDAGTLCLNGGRFSVRTRWSARDGSSGLGQAIALTEDTGYFTFFDSANVEVVVKILNGCGFNDRFWAFAGGLTDVSVVMTVTDHQTGAVRIYTNPQGTAFEPIQDTNAFASCGAVALGQPAESKAAVPPLPASISETFERGGAASCSGDPATLCLNSSRYQIRAQWFTRDGGSGIGQAVPLTADTGAFWFFSPSNIEVVIKVLNGCTFNSRRWTFAAGLTDVDVILTVTDTQTGVVRTYVNPQGTPFQPIQDTDAFASCP